MIPLLVALQVALGVFPEQPGTLAVTAMENDSGKHLAVAWPETPQGSMTVIVRRDAAAEADATWSLSGEIKVGQELGAGWKVIYVGDADVSLVDEVVPETPQVYAAFQFRRDGDVLIGGAPLVAGPVTPAAAWFNTDRIFYLALIFLTGAAFFLYLRYARRRAKDIFIRRIPGVDAIEDAVGRATEMGRPILYGTGMEDIQDIQTVASLLILGHVGKMTADYDAEIKVCCAYPMTMVVAEEVVRQGYANAGRADAHKPDNIMFITAEQFAYAAAVNGMILRDRPATNIFFGRFFAESLMLAETGYLTGAVQIAGTAEFTQLPFFIAACDYTLLGEELYAVGAYLSREPSLIAQLKAADIVKATVMLLIIAGVAAGTIFGFDLAGRLMP
jgi:hypothetical protein